uniref:Uncharacterized protein n=1 Tax=Rhizophora mucronata TaxID=61149 RepID=A0A2P2QXT2_RHIMU
MWKERHLGMCVKRNKGSEQHIFTQDFVIFFFSYFCTPGADLNAYRG